LQGQFALFSADLLREPRRRRGFLAADLVDAFGATRFRTSGLRSHGQHPNRIGAVCTEGTGCKGGVNRELLDLFEVAEDPLTNKAAIIYTSTEISTYTRADGSVHKLPEIVLAYEN
jgi:hypothetical protein